MTDVLAPVTWPSAGLATERLVLRRPHPYDGEALWQRRNDPDVARFQDWTLPYELERADDMIGEMVHHINIPPAGWTMLMIVEQGSGEPGSDNVVGDLAINRTFGGRTVEIGFTLAKDHWGKGYAVEAAGALVTWLFDNTGVTRLEAQLHPDNVASAQVLERIGFEFEGHSKRSFWVGDENSDDWFYGLTRDDYDSWIARPTGSPSTITLVEIDHSNQRSFAKLRTHKSQERFVAPVLGSYAAALFPAPHEGNPALPWFRGVEADGEPVGFVMLAAPTAGWPDPYLWRLLIDRRHQRRGIGSKVIDLVVEQCRAWGATALEVAYVEERGGPKPLYDRHGFVPTGNIEDGETEARLELT